MDATFHGRLPHRDLVDLDHLPFDQGAATDPVEFVAAAFDESRKSYRTCSRLLNLTCMDKRPADPFRLRASLFGESSGGDPFTAIRIDQICPPTLHTSADRKRVSTQSRPGSGTPAQQLLQALRSFRNRASASDVHRFLI
jgi:hypothetical protein